MKPHMVRWGILGTANIARKNWKAIQLSGNSTVVAVASRELERSRRFIAECQAEAPFREVPRPLGRYADLINREDVDAVYIPLPTGSRAEWVIRAAQAGKHVVCEKPCAPTVTELRRMLAACQEHGVQFMDGVMFMHSRRLELLRQVLDDEQELGEVRRIASAFTFLQSPQFFTDNIRTHGLLEPHGALGDLGWYCIRFALWARHWKLPVAVTGRLLSEYRRTDSPTAVPTAFSGELLFGDNVSAEFYCSFLTETEQWIRLSGSRGVVQISDFVLPLVGSELGFEVHHTHFHVRGCDFRMEEQVRRVTVAEQSHGHESSQEARMFRNFAEQAQSGQLNPLWPEAALKTQMVTNACLESARAGGQSIMPRG